MAFSLSALSPRTIIAALAAHRLARTMALDGKKLEKMAAARRDMLSELERQWHQTDSWSQTVALRQERNRQWNNPLPRTLASPALLRNLIDRGALSDPGKGAELSGNRDFLEYLHAALPFEGFVKAARHCPDNLRQEALGWALFDAPDAASARALLDEGANPDASPSHASVSHRFGYLGLARFAETLPDFRAALSRNKTWMFDHLRGATTDHYDTDVFFWLMEEGCPEALGVALESGYEPRNFLSQDTRFEHYNFDRAVNDRDNPLEFLVHRLEKMTENSPAIARDIERIDVLNRHGMKVRSSFSDDALLVHAAGRPQSALLSLNEYLEDRAPNEVIDALYLLGRKDNHTHETQFLLRQPRCCWSGEPETWGEKAKTRYASLVRALEQGALLTGEAYEGGPLLLSLIKHFDTPDNPAFDTLFERFVPQESRPLLLEKIVRHATDPTVTRWAMTKGFVPGFDHAGPHYSTARILSRQPTRAVFFEMVGQGLIDLDGLTYEAGRHRTHQSPLAIQILRFEGPDILPELMDTGWDPNQLFLVDGAELSLAQIMALPPECNNAHAESDRTGRELGKAFSNTLGSRLMEEPLKRWADILIRRFAVLEQCGVNLGLTGSAESRTADQLLGEGVTESNKEAFELLIHPLREKLEVLVDRDNLASKLRQVPLPCSSPAGDGVVTQEMPYPPADRDGDVPSPRRKRL